MATLSNKGDSIVVDGLTITIGQEYEYLDQWVTVREIQGAGRTRPGTEVCVIETRFGSISTCEADELSAKPVYKPPLTKKRKSGKV
jgi:hypothetical protein